MDTGHYAIIGGGIIGLAVARQILSDNKNGNVQVTVFEKEDGVGKHQTGHNSGVVHAGLYYEPGSLKARLCRRGAELMREYCLKHKLPYEACGKLVVALRPDDEESRLENIYKRSLANGVPGVNMISAADIRKIEPNCVGISALHSPETAIVSYKKVAEKIAEEILSSGGKIMFGKEVYSAAEGPEGIKLVFENKQNESSEETFDHVIACCGLQSDRFAVHSGDSDAPRIVPFFGQYYVIDPDFRQEVKGLIYPVPDPKFPFLGVHFTKRIDQEMTIGPNAFISFDREAYEGKKISLKDMWSYLSYPGFWKFAFKNKSATIRESKTVLSPGYFLREAAKYVPTLNNVNIQPAVRGIRAQAMGADGSLEDDFVIRRQGNITHIRNAPSPGATSSLAIAEHIVRSVING